MDSESNGNSFSGCGNGASVWVGLDSSLDPEARSMCPIMRWRIPLIPGVGVRR